MRPAIAGCHGSDRLPRQRGMRHELRPVPSADVARARRLLRREHPVLHGVLVPLAHRVQRVETVHFEVRPAR